MLQRLRDQVEAHRRRELRRATKAAPSRVEVGGELLEAELDELDAGHIGEGRDERGTTQRLGQRRDVLLDVVGPCAPHVVDRGHQLHELRLREVGAAVERLAGRSHEHGHRPTAAAGHRLHRVHVDRVDVGSFLAIDLHVDEQLVHSRGDIDVLKAVVRHHVAPMARRVADAQQHRHVAFGRLQRKLPDPTRTNRPDCRGAGEGRARFLVRDDSRRRRRQAPMA